MRQTPIKVLELFAGIGACSKALEKLGIEYEIVDAVEIDKYAIKSFNAIHNTNFEPQDITQWDKDTKVDLIMHGSPCQDFSLAGLQAGGDEGSGTRSSLMYETIRIVKKLKPKYVVWENVKNLLSKKHRHNFDSYLEIMESLGYKNYYQVLNAKDYGIPQNRERIFTVSILGDDDYNFPNGEENENQIKRLFNFSARQDCRVVYDKNGLSPTLVAGMGEGGGKVPMFVETRFEFPPKQELKLRLKDMLENEVDEKYYLSDKMLNCFMSNGTGKYPRRERFLQNINKENKDVANTIITTEGNKPTCNFIKIKNGTKQGYLEATDGDGIDLAQPNSKTRRGRVQKESIQTLTTQNNLGVCVIGNYMPSGHEASRIVDNEGIAPTIKENHGTVLATNEPRVLGGIGEKKSNGGTQWYQQDRIYDNNVGLSLSTTAQPYYPDNQLRIRKLTPKECWRLMGFDDEDFEKAEKVNSNTQLYKQAGNSIVVNVLMAIFENLLLRGKNE